MRCYLRIDGETVFNRGEPLREVIRITDRACQSPQRILYLTESSGDLFILAPLLTFCKIPVGTAGSVINHYRVVLDLLLKLDLVIFITGVDV
jgi:hypothetical protein